MLKCMSFDVEREETFLVRAKRIGGAGKPSDVPEWERVIGQHIRDKTEARVDTRNPSREFHLIIFHSGSLLGEVLWSVEKKRFFSRTPQNRPFFYAATLTPKLATCMLNLARVRKGQTVLDPFCGAGAILIECSLMGAIPIGIAIAERMVKGAMMNMKWIGGNSFGLLRGDARKIPLMQVDAIVTDPPYGKLSSTWGESSESLFSELLMTASELLRKKGFLVTLSPLKIGIEERAQKVGLKYVESHTIYVHKRMMRELVVFRR
ncbi:MAG: TIGR01177 family methyltransferase [Thermoproteota archaeon]